MENKKSSGFKGAVTAAALAALTAACANTLEGLKKDAEQLTSSKPAQETVLDKLETAVSAKDAQDQVYNIVFKQYADQCEFSVSTMVTRSTGEHGFIGAIEAPEKGMYRIPLHPRQVQMLVDGYSIDSNVAEGQFKGKVRVDYGNGRGAYHSPANFAPGTISKGDLVKMAQRAGEDFRSTDKGLLAALTPGIHLPENVWVNVPSEVFMATLYAREVAGNSVKDLKALNPKYRGTAPIGGGLSIFALTDGSNANLERVGSGLPGGIQLYCKGPASK